MNPRNPKTHVYLPGLAAHDPSHTRAALEEMGQQNATPGSVFVDTQEARTALVDRYDAKQYDLMQQLKNQNLSPLERQSLQRQYRAVTAAVHNVNVINPNVAPVPNNPGPDNGPSDILVVKGHGNPRNPNSISSRLEMVQQRENAPGNYYHQHRLLTRRGYRMSHSAQDIATGVRKISSMISQSGSDTQGLDVRMTSCGSGGTFRRDPIGGVVPPAPLTLAQNVSRQLDLQGANPRIQVSGYKGDSNSTHPTQPGGDWATKVTQKSDVTGATPEFMNAAVRMGHHAGFVPTIGNRHIEKKVQMGGLIAQQTQNHPLAPLPQTISQHVRNQSAAYTKVTAYQQGVHKPTANVPRTNARVQYRRGT